MCVNTSVLSSSCHAAIMQSRPAPRYTGLYPPPYLRTFDLTLSLRIASTVCSASLTTMHVRRQSPRHVSQYAVLEPERKDDHLLWQVSSETMNRVPAQENEVHSVRLLMSVEGGARVHTIVWHWGPPAGGGDQCLPDRLLSSCWRERGPQRSGHGSEVRRDAVPACERCRSVRVCHSSEFRYAGFLLVLMVWRGQLDRLQRHLRVDGAQRARVCEPLARAFSVRSTRTGGVTCKQSRRGPQLGLP